MKYYQNTNFEEHERRNVAFNLVRAIRDSVSIAKRVQQPITYEKAIDMVYDLDSDVYSQIINLLNTKNESDTVKYYKQMAVAKSEGLFQFQPTDLIKQDLKEHQELLKNTTIDADKLRFIKRKIQEQKGALEYFTPRKVSEHKILERDFSLEPKHEFFKKKLYETDNYKDYDLSENRVLRLRMLHPDREEAIIGADLIYEFFDLLKEEVRFIHLQYKTWDEQVLYLNQGSIKEQLTKLQLNVCRAGLCSDENGAKFPNNYRLPYCSAFFRPTNKIQSVDSALHSVGNHIPVCEVLKIMQNEPKLTRKNMRGNFLTSDNFMDLFIGNILGSRWIRLTSLEKYYEEKDILSLTNSIRVHAQEVQTYSEEAVNTYKSNNSIGKY